MSRSTVVHEVTDPILDKVVSDAMAEFPTPGLAVLFIQGEEMFAKGYGYSNIEKKIPITPKSLFLTGSTTKSFTSAIAAQLVESPDYPQIRWNTKLADLIRDDFVLSQDSPEGQWATNHVTIEDALSHRTGMSNHGLILTDSTLSHQDMVRLLRHVPLHRGLRERFEYCNIMYAAIAHSVETILGQEFGSVLKNEIFDPLGMEHTAYSLKAARNIDQRHGGFELATGYYCDLQLRKFQPVPWSDINPPTGGGGIVSNVLDFGRWLQHLLKPTDLTMALSSNVVKAMRTPRMIVEPDDRTPFVGPQAYCLGLTSQVYRNREILQHNGGSLGFMSNMLIVPPTPAELEKGIYNNSFAVVTMQNTFSFAKDIVMWHLLDRFLGTPEDERFDMTQKSRDIQKSVQQALEPQMVCERLFGLATNPSRLLPSLPLQKYEGLYRHAAYPEFKITQSTSIHDIDKVTTLGKHAASNAISPSLYIQPSDPHLTCSGMTYTLHHVSQDWWYCHSRVGPFSWVTDQVRKMQFVVGLSGEVEGMRFQAEPNMLEELPLFKKVG